MTFTGYSHRTRSQSLKDILLWLTFLMPSVKSVVIAIATPLRPLVSLAVPVLAVLDKISVFVNVSLGSKLL